MECKVAFKKENCADAVVSLRAPGFVLAVLYWANQEGVLNDWTPLAYIPMDACGKGSFVFGGQRAIPPAATHIAVRAVSDDLLRQEEILVEIPEAFQSKPLKLQEESLRLCLMSDLHLSSKSGVLAQAFFKAKYVDALLLAGDMTNDGYRRQFEHLKECIQNVIPDTPVFSVRGNHDVPREMSNSMEKSDISNYLEFQEWLHKRLENNYQLHETSNNFLYNKKYPLQWKEGPEGMYAFRIGTDIEIIGLQAISEKRQFLFPEGKQLCWLDEHLQETKDLRWRLILCHAPLFHHKPKREREEQQHPYLHRDKELQTILDRQENIVFLSGHTHISMDELQGCVEWDEEHKNIYINDGSIRPTNFCVGESLQAKEWKDGICLYLTIQGDEMEIVTQSIKNERNHARGYYRIRKNTRNLEDEE